MTFGDLVDFTSNQVKNLFTLNFTSIFKDIVETSKKTLALISTADAQMRQNIEGGGVAREDRALLADLVQLVEDLFLDRHGLEHASSFGPSPPTSSYYGRC